MSNFENLSSKDKKVFIDLTEKVKTYKEGLKQFYSIAEDQGDFDEFAENLYSDIFLGTNFLELELFENDNDEGAN
tara:strand:+ start:22673 stop:22897 length:225 start_codon:yes stop_codon:yes gene_type:complete